jgi:hypothetical protein
MRRFLLHLALVVPHQSLTDHGMSHGVIMVRYPDGFGPHFLPK